MSRTRRLLAGVFVSFILISAGVTTQERGPGRGHSNDPCEHLDERKVALVQRLQLALERIGIRLPILEHFRQRCDNGGSSSSGIARGDFNGDGFADLAVGVPGEEEPGGPSDSGAVNVIYGSGNGLTTTDAGVPAAQLWTQNNEGVPDASDAGDKFGSALAAGDFNDDGFSDLAIGAPSEVTTKNGAASIGLVFVIYGSPDGLAASGPQMVLSAQSWAITDLNAGGQIQFFAALRDSDVPPNLSGSFGASLAWGDFDGDGIGDLAVGSPLEDIGSFGNRTARAGAVGIIFGSSNGLVAGGSQVWTQNSNSIQETAATDDLFGHALAGGDFNADSVTDLAIGVPGEDVSGTDSQGGGTIERAGAVQILFGLNAVGLTSTNDRLLDVTSLLLSADATGVSQAGDNFGATLAAGDFDGNGFDDLAAGAHLRNSRGRSNSGAVLVDYNGRLGTFVPVTQFWDQSRAFGDNQLTEVGASSSESDDRFGRALAAGDFNADGRDDLAIGVPFEDVMVNQGTTRQRELLNAGAVDVIYGSTTGLSITGQAAQHWTQNTLNVDDTVEEEDFFGTSLTAWNFGRNQLALICLPGGGCFQAPISVADLAIGIVLEDTPQTQVDAGAVAVLYGCRRSAQDCLVNGLSAGGFAGTFPDQLWTQGSPGVPNGGGAETGDDFGRIVY